MPHTRSLLRVARRLMFDSDSAEDLVQDTMLSAWRGFAQFQPGSNARAWLFRIMMNAFHAQARKMQPAMVPLGRDIPAGSAGTVATEVGRALQELTVEHRTVLL
ncbi:MAG: RNA polymerase sigma factor, partial [Candidatus Acidiferrales bacterium]